MTHRLDGSLALMRPALAPALVPPSALDRLHALARRLPPVHYAGFECRLRDDDPRVDLQQGISQRDDDARTVARFATDYARRASGPRADAWSVVGRFCDAWSDPANALAAHVGELWLEFDVDEMADVEDALTPSIFAVLHGAAGRRPPGAARAREVAPWIVGATDASPVDDLLTCWGEALSPDGACVSHVGVMLGRQPSGLRVHVAQLPFRRLAPFLAHVGWAGDIDRVSDAARLLFDYVDEVVLCFDVVLLASGVHLVPRIGLEGFFAQKVGVDPRWDPLLAELAQREYAAPAKCDALLQWTGGCTPLDAPGAWPDDLVVRSLRAPWTTLGRFERRLSHVKLLVDGAAPVSAKAYFGYGHLWSAAPVPATATSAGASPMACAARASNGSLDSLDAAIGGAEAFLLAARNQGGWWRDFYDFARSAQVGERVGGYASDEWVTAYVGTMLATSARPTAMDAAREAWELLARRRSASTGWGYHPQLPPDADSTAWALRLAAAVGMAEHPRTAGGRRFLASQTQADGGVACYRREDCPAIATFLRMAGPYDGWCAPHTCVTAAVATLACNCAHRAHLLGAQRDDGRWTGHWWDDDEYATAIAIGALARDPAERSRRAVARAAAWMATRVGPTGAVHSASHGAASAFATALATLAIAAAPTPTDPLVATRLARWLMDAQRPNGSFEPSARLRVPAPSARDPLASPETTLTYLDRDATFTTATVFAALGALRRAGVVGS